MVPGELCFPVCSPVMLAGRSSCSFIHAGSKQTQTKEAQPASGTCPGGHNRKGCNCEGYGAHLTSFSPYRNVFPQACSVGILPALHAEGWLRSALHVRTADPTEQRPSPCTNPNPLLFVAWLRSSHVSACRRQPLSLSAAGASCLRLGQRSTLLLSLFFQDAAGTFWGRKMERLGLLGASVPWVAVGSGAENKLGCPPLIAASPSC